MPPSPLSFGSQCDSGRFASIRDARILWLLSQHPVTAATLVALGWFPNRNKALRRLRRLVQRKRIRLVGVVCRKAGRPEHVYCRYRSKQDTLTHEVELTELCLRLDAGRIVRDPRAVDRRLRPDAEVWINGDLYHLELDRGTMGLAQIERRFRQYEGSPHFVLWVCGTAGRRDDFRVRAERIRSIALFTTFAEILASPHGAVWLDHAGGQVSLPREDDRSETGGEAGG